MRLTILDKIRKIFKENRIRHIWARITCVLIAFVILFTAYVMIVPAVTWEKMLFCTLEEHTHGVGCYENGVLVCTKTEHTHTDACFDPAPTPDDGYRCGRSGHKHTAYCYFSDGTLNCVLTEHEHTLDCLSDDRADCETREMWEASMAGADLSGRPSKRVYAIADTQLGYTESTRNYRSNGTDMMNGYTRYGAWFGNTYADWSAMFAGFCMYYAGAENIPFAVEPGAWVERLHDAGLFVSAFAHEPEPGDAAFWEAEDGIRVGIVSGADDENIFFIEGDVDGAVARTYTERENVFGYAVMPENAVERLTAVPVEVDPAALEKPLLLAPSTGGYWVRVTSIDDASANYVIASPDGHALGIDREQNWSIIWGTYYTYTAGSQSVAFTPVTGVDNYYTAAVGGAYQWNFSTTGNSSQTIKNAEYTDYGLRLSNSTWIDTTTAANTLTYSNGNWTIRNDKRYLQYSSNAFSRSSNNDATYANMVIYKHVDDLPGYTVTFQPNGGTGSSKSLIAPKNAALAAGGHTASDLPVYTRDHYAFAGWSTSQTGGTIVTDPAVILNTVVNANTTYYARWTPKYTVTYTPGDGVTGTPVSAEVVSGSTALNAGMTPPTYTREGYVFAGWSPDGGTTILTDSQTLNAPVTGDVTYTAVWLPPRTVSFNLGTHAPDIDAISPITVPHGTSIPAASLPTPLWHAGRPLPFEGWYLDSSLTTPYTNQAITADTTLYAKFGSADSAYYVYYYDFDRSSGQTSVLRTFAVPEGVGAPSFDPTTSVFPPAGKAWDGKWYLDAARTQSYNPSMAVSDLVNYLTGEDHKDIYLYPGMNDVCRVIFNTNGTRIEPFECEAGTVLTMSNYETTRQGYTFAGWYTDAAFTQAVGSTYEVNGNTTFYAKWDPDYTSFTAVRHSENAEDYGFTSTGSLGTWYALSGSEVYVRSSGTTHRVYCKLPGDPTEYPVYASAPTRTSTGWTGTQATIPDEYDDFFIFCNDGTTEWEDFLDLTEPRGYDYEHPVTCDSGTILSSGDSIVAVSYLRVRVDLTFNIPNSNDNSGGYMDMYTLYRSGIVTGTTTAASAGNRSASGVFPDGVEWEYTAASSSSGNNVFVLKGVKYEGPLADKWPVKTWVTPNRSTRRFYSWDPTNAASGTNHVSKLINLTTDYYHGTYKKGRNAQGGIFKATFNGDYSTALMYAIECLPGETPDFTVNNVGYKIDDRYTQEVATNSSLSAKQIAGCGTGSTAYSGTSGQGNLNTTRVNQLLAQRADQYFGGKSTRNEFDNVNIFKYNRSKVNVTFDYQYDNIKRQYTDILWRQNISNYRTGIKDGTVYPTRDGYRFVGWANQFGELITEEEWDNMVADVSAGESELTFYAKWEPLNGHMIEFYMTKDTFMPFETHIFHDNDYIKAPTSVQPDYWVWTNSDLGVEDKYTGDFPLYGEYGVQEMRDVDGDGLDELTWVIKVYGVWLDSYVHVLYDVNQADGGNSANTPLDEERYQPFTSSVPVMAMGIEDPINTQDKIFAGWKLNKNNVIYYPGDHVPVEWGTTMIFKAQWIEPDRAVHLRYEPNGGTPNLPYPDSTGLVYDEGVQAIVWDDRSSSNAFHFTRQGYYFAGWNTKADGTGTAYMPGSTILMDEDKVLYAQWMASTFTLTIHKVDAGLENFDLSGAVFTLEKKNGSSWTTPVTLTVTDADGLTSTGADMERNTIYRLTEIVPPTGYHELESPIYFQLDDDGDIISCTAAGAEVDGLPYHVLDETFDSTSKVLTLTIGNVTGPIFPETGSAGELLFFAAGLLMTAASGCLLICAVLRKRRSE